MDRSKWEYKKLGEVCIDFVVPQRDKPTAFDGDIPWCRIEDIDGRYLNGSKSGQNVTRELADKMNMHLCPKGTVISACSASIGTQAITTTECYTNQTFIGLVVNPDLLYNVYLYYYLESKSNMLQGLGQGATIKYISKNKYQNMTIPLPSVEDQQRIVAELDCLNEMIALKQEQLKEFDKLAQSIFYDMFGDPMDNIHVWEISVLQDVVSENCSISYGIVQPGDDVENGVPVVRPVDLVNQVVYKDGLKIVDKAISDSYKRTILRGDELLFCVRGTTGIISFASEELEGCNVTRGITPLEFGDRIDRYYAYYLLNTPYLQSIIAEKTNGIALKQINMRDARLLPIMCPPLALQQQFAEKIQAIEAQKELVKQSIAETQHLFDSRMDYYFD